MAGGKPAVQVTGAKEFRRAMAHMGANLEDLRAVNLEASKVVSDDAHGRAPKRTGNLASDIRPTATKSAGRVLVGRKRIEYAGVIHFGWPAHNIAAQPFLFDALDHEKSKVETLYVKRVDALVRRVAQETPP